MDTTGIAERATAARNALAELAKAVATLPPPGFNFTRSIELLGQLADWADRGRQRSGFSEAEILNWALSGTLEKGCGGRQAAPMKSVREPEVPEASSVVEVSSDPALSARKKMAKLLGQVGGKKRTKKKIAAARANMRVVNQRRWGNKWRRKRTGR